MEIDGGKIIANSMYKEQGVKESCTAFFGTR